MGKEKKKTCPQLHLKEIEEWVSQNRQEKEIIDGKLALERQIEDEILIQLLKKKKISVTFLMRKFKCNAEKAKEIIVSVTTHECCDWNFMKINYFSPEFQGTCACFVHAT